MYVIWQYNKTEMYNKHKLRSKQQHTVMKNRKEAAKNMEEKRCKDFAPCL